MASKTIFMIHGMWQSSANWHNYVTFFEQKGYTVITPNLRHHENPKGNQPLAQLGELSLLDYVSDLVHDLRKLDKKPIIMGHCMGGLLAQILASLGLASQVVLITPAPPAGIFMFDTCTIKLFKSIFYRWGFWHQAVSIKRIEASLHLFTQLNNTQQHTAYHSLRKESGRALAEIIFWFFDRQQASKVNALKIKCPMLVMGCEKDQTISNQTARKIAKKYAHTADYIELKNQGHWILSEPGWEHAASTIAVWLANRKINIG